MESAVFKTQNIFEIKGKGIVITGSVTSGTLCIGMTSTINNCQTEVQAIEMFRRSVSIVHSASPEAKAIGVLLTNVTKSDVEQFLKLHPMVVFNSTQKSERILHQPTLPITKSSAGKKIAPFIMFIGFLILLILILSQVLK